MITQCPQYSRKVRQRVPVLGEQVLGEEKFVGCNTDSPAITQAGQTQALTRLRIVQMPTVLSAC
jgi:hypothetical protein